MEGRGAGVGQEAFYSKVVYVDVFARAIDTCLAAAAAWGGRGKEGEHERHEE